MQLKLSFVLFILFLFFVQGFSQNPCISKPEIISKNTSGLRTTVICNGDPLTLSSDISLSTCPNCTYKWNTGSTDAFVFAFTPGTYIVTVTDNTLGGCTGVSTQVDITASTLAIPVLTKDSNHFCNGNRPLLTIANPCTNCSYQWYISNPTGGKTPVNSSNSTGKTSIFSPTDTGDYFVEVTDNATVPCKEQSKLNMVRKRTVSKPMFLSTTQSICDSNIATLSTINCVGCHYEWQYYDFEPHKKLIISGVFHGTRFNGTASDNTDKGEPYGIELYALGNIPDLSVYEIRVIVDGNVNNPKIYKLPASGISGGRFIHLTESANEFTEFFGFSPYAEFKSLQSSNPKNPGIDGNEVIELYHSGTLSDVYGDIATANTQPSPWTYKEGWAYRTNTTSAPKNVFMMQEWSREEKAFMTLRKNSFWTADSMPARTYKMTASPKEGLILTAVFAGGGSKPKGVEIYAQTHIEDLADYSIRITNGTSGQQIISLPSRLVKAKEHLYITDDATKFQNFFSGQNSTSVIERSGMGNLTGDDTVEILKSNDSIDLFRAKNVQGTATWNYTDGWARSQSGRLPSVNFDSTSWVVQTGAWANCIKNDSCGNKKLLLKSRNYPDYPSGIALSAIFDGNRRTSSEARGIELYAYDDVDLKNYTIKCYLAGPTQTIKTITFNARNISSGSYVYITRDKNEFDKLFPVIAADTNVIIIEKSDLNVLSGNTAVELRFGDQIVDIIGDKSHHHNTNRQTNYNGMSWSYLDGWLYRKPNVGVNKGTFDASKWILSKYAYRGRNDLYTSKKMKIKSYKNTSHGTVLNVLPVTDTFFYSTSVVGDYKVKVTYDNGCEALSDFISLDTLAFEPSITAYMPSSKDRTSTKAYLCYGSTVELFIDSPYLAPPSWTYQWSRNSVPILNGTGYRYSATAPGLYRVTVKNHNGCTSFSNVIEVINSTNGANPTISASTLYLCSDKATSTLTTSSCVGCSYSWRKEPDANPISSPTDEINFVVNGNGSGGQAGGYFVKVKDLVSTCTYKSSTVQIKDTVYPTPTMTASGNTVCSRNPITLRTDACPGCKYEWVLNSTSGVKDSITTQAIYSTRTSGKYKVKIMYPNLCETGYSNTIQATFQTINANLVTPPYASICKSRDTLIKVRIKALPETASCPGCTYTFLRNNVAMRADSLKDQQTIAVGGSYKVIVKNEQLCADTSSAVVFKEVNINTNIRQSANKICSPTSEVIMEVDSCDGCSYQWYFNNRLLTTSRDTFYRAYGDSAANKTYRVVVSKAGCEAKDFVLFGIVPQRFVKIGVDTTVSNQPIMCDGSRVVLVDKCDTCISNRAYNYQWFSLTDTLVGATFESFQIDTPGRYYLQTVDANLCVVLSDTITVEQFFPDPALALDFSTLGAGGVVPITYGSFLINDFLYPPRLRSRGAYTSLTAQAAITNNTDSLNVEKAGSGSHFITYKYTESNAQGSCEFSTMDTLEVLGAVDMTIANTRSNVPSSEACIGDTLKITLTNFTFVPDTVIFVRRGGSKIPVGVSPNLRQFAGVYSGSFEVQVPTGARTGKVTVSDRNNSFQSPNFFVIQNPAVTIDLVSTIQPICSNLDTVILRGLPSGGTLTASYIGMPVDASLMTDTLLLLDSIVGYTNGIQHAMIYYKYLPSYTGSTVTCPAILDSLQIEIRDNRLDSVVYTPISKTQASEPLTNLTKFVYPSSTATYPNSYQGTYVLANNLRASTIPLAPYSLDTLSEITYNINNGGCENKSVDTINIWRAPVLLDTIPVFLCSKDDTVFIERNVTGVTLRYRDKVIFDSLYAYKQHLNVSVGNPLETRYSEYINLMEITTSNGGVDSINFFAPNESYYFVPANVTGNSTRITMKFKYKRVTNHFRNGSFVRRDTTGYTIAEVSKLFQIENPSTVTINPTILADTTFCPDSTTIQLLGSPAGGKYFLRGSRANTLPYQRLPNNIYNPRNYPINASYQLTYVSEGRACVDSASTGIFVPDTFSIAVKPNNLTGNYCLTSPDDTVKFNTINSTNTTIDSSSAQFFVRGIQTATIFSPSQVGPAGKYHIRYVVSDIYGCSEEATDTFQVFPIPVLSKPAIDSVFCRNDDTARIHLFENSDSLVNVTSWDSASNLPTGDMVWFTGAGVVNGGLITATSNPIEPYFSPQLAQEGTHLIRYIYKDANNCMDSIPFSIKVLPLPEPSLVTTNRRPLKRYYCENDSIPLFGYPIGTSLNSGYGSYVDSTLNPPIPSSLDSADTAFEPNVSGFSPGIVKEWLYYYYEDRNGCRDTVFHEVKIRNFTTDPKILGFDNTIGRICASDTNIVVKADPNGGFDLDSLGWFTSSFEQAFSQLTDTLFTDSTVFNPASTGIVFADRDVILTFNYTDTSRTCYNSISDIVRVLALPHLTLSERLVTSLPTMDPIGSKLIAPRSDTFQHICETTRDVPIYAYNTRGTYDLSTGNLSLFVPDHISPDTGTYVRGRGVISNGGATNIAYAYSTSSAGFGLDTIRYVYKDSRGCIDSVQYSIVVDSLPVLSFAGLSNFDSTIMRYVYCESEPNPPSVLPAPTGVSWTLSFNGENITSVPFALLPDTLAVAGTYMDYALRYDYIGQIYQSGAVCRDSLLDTIQIRPSPQMAWVNAPSDFCMSDSSQRVALSATPHGGQFVDATNNFQVVAGIVNDSLFNPSAQAGKRDIYYYYLDTTSGCGDTIRHTIYVYTQPKINFDLTGGCLGTQAMLVPRTEPYGLQYNGVAIDSITQVIWNYGDGAVDTIVNLPDTTVIPRSNHVYSTYGVFYPSLKVVNQGVCDTTFVRRIVISPKIIPYDTLPYVQAFDNAANGWFQASSDTLSINGIVQDSLWEWGVPNGNTINTRLNGNTVWTTRLSRTYGQGEDGWVYSPCFDLTNLDRPMIKLDIWRATQKGFDGAVLQYYDDSTQAWVVLGKHGKGINWYQDEFVVSSPGNQVGIPRGWTGKNATWEDARYRLDNVGNDLRNRDNIRFRIAFASDPGTLLGLNDGFAFDNVMVGNRTRNVLVEHFSAVGYPGINQIENELYRTIYNNLYGRDVSLIQYHSDQYLPNDPIYLLNPVDNRQRRFLYSVTNPDEVRVDGKFGANSTSDLLNYPELEVLDIESLKDPKFKIEFLTFPNIQYNGPNSGMQATIRVTALKDMPLSNYSIMATVTKDSIVTLSGHTTRAVLLANFPDNGGTTTFRRWSAGDSVEVQISLPNVNPSIHPNTSLLQLVTFVQDISTNPKEIFQVETTRNLNIFTGSVDSVDVSVITLPGVEATQLKLFPNPATQQFQVVFDAPLKGDYEWELVNALGQSLRQGKATTGTTNLQVDTDDLTAGFYVFIIRNKNVYVQRKVLVKKP